MLYQDVNFIDRHVPIGSNLSEACRPLLCHQCLFLRLFQKTLFLSATVWHSVMKRVTEISVKLIQRINIHFCVKVGWSLPDTRKALQHVFGGDTIGRSWINFWYKQFKEGRTELVDLHRRPRERSGRSQQNIQTVQNLINNDKRMTVQAIQNASGIPSTTVHRILKKDLHLKLKCARFIPRNLTPRHLRLRLETAQKMLRLLQAEPNYLERVITSDETWVHQYDPETRRQSSEWLAPGENRPVKARHGQSNRKCMLVTFFDFKGMVHFEFVRNRTVNAQIFCQILGRLKVALQTKRPRNRRPILHMDNASSHTARPTRTQLLFTGIKTLTHLPCSPDIAPSDFWLYPRLKNGLRGKDFPTLDALEAAVGREIGLIASQEYTDCIMKTWPKRWARCVYRDGNYFEGLD